MNQYPELDYCPCEVDLSDKEKVDLQLQSFYLNHPLHESKALLWLLYRGWLQHEATVGSDAAVLDHMLVFHEDMERLLSAAYVQLKMGAQEAPQPMGFLEVPGGFPGELLPVLELLVKVIDPEQMFLCRYPDFSGEHLPEKVELLIMVKDNGKRFTELQPYLDLAMLTQQHCNCTLFIHGRLEDAFRYGHLYYLMSCTKETLIYNPHDQPLPKVDVAQLSERKAEMEQHFNFSKGMVDSFLTQAKQNREHGNWRLTAFMLHQCVEHCYRAIIQACTGEDKKTHEVSVLAKRVERFSPVMRAVFPGDTPKEQRFLKLLDAIYAKARYMDSFRVDEKDLAELLRRVELLYSATLTSFKELMGLLDIGE